MRRVEVPEGGELRVSGPVLHIPVYADSSLFQRHGLDAPTQSNFLPYIQFTLTLLDKRSSDFDAEQRKKSNPVPPVATSSGVPLYPGVKYGISMDNCRVRIANGYCQGSIVVNTSIVFPCSNDELPCPPWMERLRHKILHRVSLIVSANSPELELHGPLYTQLCCTPATQRVVSKDMKNTDGNDFSACLISEQYRGFVRPVEQSIFSKRILLTGPRNQGLYDIARSLINFGINCGSCSSNLIDLDPEFSEVWRLYGPRNQENLAGNFFRRCISAQTFPHASDTSSENWKEEINLFVGDSQQKDHSLYDHSVFHLSRLMKSREKNMSKRKLSHGVHSTHEQERTYVVFPFDMCDIIEEQACKANKRAFNFRHDEIDSIEKRFAALVKWFEIDTIVFMGAEFGAHCLLDSLTKYFSDPTTFETKHAKPQEKTISMDPFTLKLNHLSLNVFLLPCAPSKDDRFPCKSSSVHLNNWPPEESAFGNVDKEFHLREQLHHYIGHADEIDESESNWSLTKVQSDVECTTRSWDFDELISFRTYMGEPLGDLLTQFGCPRVSCKTEKLSSTCRNRTFEIEWEKFSASLVVLANKDSDPLEISGNNEFRDFVLPFADPENTKEISPPSSKMKPRPRIKVKEYDKDEPGHLLGHLLVIFHAHMESEDGEKAERGSIFTLANEMVGFAYISASQKFPMHKISLTTPLEQSTLEQGKCFLLYEP
ncbi:tRNA (guanine-N(7)-)-methyltransferase [Perkinsela sp. CCAP 1560/4]|nr:tRNA (guanine-N(7)-)-methyltransferase [Perkinsela sp. CCAP 1560/4]|eukprot:KNH08073.1 tRNA (guanine-N(7)-)-methyltransferase [Perkinsela sp. CCAP 1560/4]